MSVWKVREIFKGRKGGLSEGVERKYTRVFQVFTNSKLDGPIEVMFAADPSNGEFIPALYSSFADFGGSTDILAICRSIDPVQDDDDWTIWTVTCEYSTESPRGDQAGQISGGGSPGNPGTGSGATADPSLEPPVVEWSSWSREVVQTIEPEPVGEALPKPILNSAYRPFDPMPTREITGDVLVLERNELEYIAFFASEYRMRVNEGEFIWTGDTRQWLCKQITAKRVYKGNFRYHRVRYEFHHCGDAETWDHSLLDAGYEKLDIDDKPVPIMGRGQTAQTAPLLNGAGQPLSKNDLIESGPVFLTFRKYRTADFDELGIEID